MDGRYFERRSLATAPAGVQRLARSYAATTRRRAVSWTLAGNGGAYVYFEPLLLTYFPPHEVAAAERT